MGEPYALTRLRDKEATRFLLLCAHRSRVTVRLSDPPGAYPLKKGLLPRDIVVLLNFDHGTWDVQRVSDGATFQINLLNVGEVLTAPVPANLPRAAVQPDWRKTYSTYGVCPRPISDFQVRSDGTTRKLTKTHELPFEQIEWLLDPKPEVLIIALGWDGVTTPDDRIRGHKGCEIHILKSKEAIDLFNRLKRSGKRVAIHYHSTC